MKQSDTETTPASSTICLACLQPFGTGLYCVHCGAAADKVPWEAPQLVPGTKIHGRYLIGRALGKGGFAITYLALQEGLNRRVAIKEYFPFDMAERSKDSATVRTRQITGGTVTVQGYRRGVERFLEEGQNIVQCHQPNPHPNIVRVTDFFEENGTAYLVMDYVEGISLENFLKAQPRSRMDERQARELILPVLSGLSAVHKHGFLHRDVKPGNIYISKQGTVILLDFGSARQALSDERHTLTVMLTPGYAPPEQYSGDGEQGPWTDVYATAATMYRCVTGETPPSAMSRISSTEMLPPSSFPEVRINGRIEKAIMAGLELDRANRIQSAEQFQQALSGGRAEMLYEAVAISGLLRNPKRLIRLVLSLVAVFALVALATTAARLIWNGLADTEPLPVLTEENKAPSQAEGLYQAGTMLLNTVVAKVSGSDVVNAALNAGQTAMAARSCLDTDWVAAQSGEAYKTAVLLYLDGERALGEGRYGDAQAAYGSAAGTFADIILRDNTAASRPQAALAAIQERVARQRADIKGGKAPSADPVETAQAEDMFNQAAAEADPDKAVDLYRQASAIYAKVLPAESGAQDFAKDAQRKRAEAAERARNQGMVDPSITVQEVDMGAGVKLALVQVPAGEFLMGSPDQEPERQDDEGPQHRVVITKSFWMGRFEVTVAQFARFTEQTGYRTTAENAGGAWNITETLKQEWEKDLDWHKTDYNKSASGPVVLVSWDDTQAYCRWLSEATGRLFRLPTEAEWEYACRAGSATAFQWGDAAEDGKGWLNGADEKLRAKQPQWRIFPFSDGHIYAARGGSYRGNVWGLHDMHGNVWEWCQDWHSPEFYAASPEADPCNGQMDRFHVARGGSWLCYPGFCRSAVRHKYAPEYTTCDLGFRVVMAE